MKNKKFIMYLVLFVCLLILLGVGIGVSLFMNNKTSYQTLLNSSNKNYEVNVVFDGEDTLTFYGEYDSKTNSLKMYDDEENEVVLQHNIYKEMLSYLPDKQYEKDGIVNIIMLSSDLKKQVPFINFPSLGTYSCEYEIYDKTILAIRCSKEDNRITIDFNY